MGRKDGAHFARYESSERLQRFLALMLDGVKRSTRQISRSAEIYAVNSAAFELRQNGFRCECIHKCRPAIYQLQDVEAARVLSKQLLARKGVVSA